MTFCVKLFTFNLTDTLQSVSSTVRLITKWGCVRYYSEKVRDCGHLYGGMYRIPRNFYTNDPTWNSTLLVGGNKTSRIRLVDPGIFISCKGSTPISLPTDTFFLISKPLRPKFLPFFPRFGSSHLSVIRPFN